MRNLLLALWMFSIPLLLHAGGSEVGNGSDDVPEDSQSAWFLGKGKTIHACMVIDADFGVSQNVAAASVQAAFQQWLDYLNRQHVSGMYTDRLQLEASCVGTEDLRIYFGTINEEVSKALAEFYDPLAFTRRLHFDPNTGWGNGILWIGSPGVPDGSGRSFPAWSIPQVYYALLLHEMGHVFGNPHVPGTIMMANLAQVLKNRYQQDASDSPSLLAPITIDQGKTLYSKFPGGGVFSMRLPPLFPQDSERLAGRPVDENSLTCQASATSEHPGQEDPETVVRVECKDRHGSFSYTVRSSDSERGDVEGDNDCQFKVFRQALLDGGRMWSDWACSNPPAVKLGLLAFHDGSKASVWIDYYTLNEEGPISLSLALIQNGKRRQIFQGGRRDRGNFLSPWIH